MPDSQRQANFIENPQMKLRVSLNCDYSLFKGQKLLSPELNYHSTLEMKYIQNKALFYRINVLLGFYNPKNDEIISSQTIFLK